MDRDHDFKEVPDSQKFDKKRLLFTKDWHCQKCDTIVRYPANYNQFDINKAVMKSQLICKDPVIVRQ